MKFRRLGDSDLEVSEISLGSWLTYSGGVEREQTEACTERRLRRRDQLLRHRERLRRRRRRGGLGRDPLRTIDRDSYVLATKVFFPMSETRQGALAPSRSTSRSTPRSRACRPTTSTSTSATASTSRRPIEETMEALTEVVEAGKARYIGFSEWTPEQIRAGARGAGRREVRLLPAAVQHDLARARGGGLPALRRARDLADRLVAARPGRADRQVRAGRAAARRLARRQRRRWAAPIDRYMRDELLGGGPAPAADRRGARA